jgi:hypothetical protein
MECVRKQGPAKPIVSGEEVRDKLLPRLKNYSDCPLQAMRLPRYVLRPDHSPERNRGCRSV